MLSITELTDNLKQLVYTNLNEKLFIVGEVTNAKKSHKHLFFKLKDENAMIDAVFWNITDDIANMDISDGIKVQIEGYINYYQKNSTLQINCKKIERFGIGDLHVEYEKIKQKCIDLGYFDDGMKKSLPQNIKKIGVVTSLTGAAIKDFLYVLNNSNFSGKVYTVDAIVQGNQCSQSVASGIKKLDKLNLDAIIITRGGGSFEDLYGFSDYKLLKTIYNANTCIISAIGHEVDFMLSDFVADIRAPTPSIAAQIVSINNPNKILQTIQNTLQNTKISLLNDLYNYHEQIKEIDRNIINVEILIKNIIISNQYKINNINNNIISELLNISGQLDNLLTDINDSPSKILEQGYSMVYYMSSTVKGKEKSIKSLKDYKKAKRLNKEIKIVFKDGAITINNNNAKK